MSTAAAYSANPVVTICLPVYRGAEWIARAIDSCLQQTYEQFELLIVDNASPDETASIARSFHDARVRLIVNSSNIGMSPNHNRAIHLARGRFIKFLHADDVLKPNCLEEMLNVIQQDDRIGLVFSRREVLLADESDVNARIWFEQFRDLHLKFDDLGEVNNGRALLDQWMQHGFGENWIGEPSAVLVRARCFEELGGFNPQIRMLSDVDMWARIMSVYDVGFVDEELCSYLHHQQSATAHSVDNERHWLDRLWITESLLQFEHNTRRYPQLRTMRRAELRHATRSLLGEPITLGRRSKEFLKYFAVRLRGHDAHRV